MFPVYIQFIYTQNQQFSGNSKIIRFEFLRVIKQRRGYPYGFREAWLEQRPGNTTSKNVDSEPSNLRRE